MAIDAVLNSAVGKPLREVFLTELLGKINSRPFLEEAVSALADGDYYKSLIATRKAFFLEFESEYCIYDYRNDSKDGISNRRLLSLLMLNGRKAHYWTRNSEWIADHVTTPFDYVQINHETWRVDAMEWGINTQTLNNIRHLTPAVIQLEFKGEWYIKQPTAYAANSVNRENAATCLDLTIEVIRRRHDHIRAARRATDDEPYDTPPAYIGQPVLERPAEGSKELYVLGQGDTYVVDEMLTGFDATKTFYRIKCTVSSGDIFRGYVERLDELPLDEAGP